jgi:hypothetical protein
MSKNKMKTGDMVLVIDSYGGGIEFLGRILPFIRKETKPPHNRYPNCIHLVSTYDNGSVYCEAVPLTPLLKALV